jgi:hypothetical protein
MRRNEEAIKKWNKIVAECEQIAKENMLPNGKKIILENIFPLALHATTEIHPTASCPFLGKEAWVNHEGRYENSKTKYFEILIFHMFILIYHYLIFRFDPCCAPDTERKQLGSFGNVQEAGLLKLWNAEEYKKLVENYYEKYIYIYIFAL